jgi:hypothetical protein
MSTTLPLVCDDIIQCSSYLWSLDVPRGLVMTKFFVKQGRGSIP